MKWQNLLTAYQGVHIALFDFIINLILVALLTYLLGRLYVACGGALSNRKRFSANFIPLGMTTMIIIVVVKSSLALSLGLVGALSIVRFRTAIKEPEELTYLFLTIAIGLGLGADQRAVTILGTLVVGIAMWLKQNGKTKIQSQNLYLNIAATQGNGVDLPKIVAILNQHCTSVDLKRFDAGTDRLEAAFLVEVDQYVNLHHIKEALQRISPMVEVTFLEHKGLGEYAN